MKKIILGLVACAASVELTLLWFYNPAETKIFIPCLFRLVTGVPCPGCGMQRAIHLLLHGRIIESMLMCPFAYFLAVVFASMWLFPNATRKLSFAVTVVTCVLSYSSARILGFAP